ncbi:MAG: GAF domain-containing protein [Chloroflexi bacterium]|nr:GAF domain-containing protein [Chloroflexota bacterium]
MPEPTQMLLSIQNQFRELTAQLSNPYALNSLKLLEQRVQSTLSVQLGQLGALMDVGQAVNSSLGLKKVLEVVMDSLIRLMQAERGFLMLKDPSGKLTIQTARGVAEGGAHEEAFSGSTTIIRTVSDSGRPILTTNAQDDPRFEMQYSVAALQLRSILCAPLKLKDDLIGVIYVDHRGMPDVFHDSDMNLISAFADQAAVAIDNARLFEDLKAANKELEIAYEATLQGWVRALDLRDKETEGHTQRVTNLSVKLADAMGVERSDLIHIQRGALLHDIGKMAIPDAVLLKPDSLTEEERTLIRQHPIFAYEMLKPIQFLHRAIDIPYCHHEKWDGTGYPRALKELEIPFSARIFSIVDVWDALTSDRVYRKALPAEEVRAHLRQQSGRHFDPRVAEAFLDLVAA